MVATSRVALLGGRRWRGFTQRLGELSEDPVCWSSARDVMRSFLHGRPVLWAVSRGDITIDCHRHYGVEFRMVEELGSVTVYFTAVTDPPTIISEADAVARVAVERRLVKRRQVTDERVEPLGLLLRGEQALSGAHRPTVGQQVLHRRDHLAGRPCPGEVPIGSVEGLPTGGLAFEGVALGVRIGQGGVREVGERGALEAEWFDDSLAVELSDGFVGHLLQDEAEQDIVGVGILSLGAGIEQRRILEADLH